MRNGSDRQLRSQPHRDQLEFTTSAGQRLSCDHGGAAAAGPKIGLEGSQQGRQSPTDVNQGPPLAHAADHEHRPTELDALVEQLAPLVAAKLEPPAERGRDALLTTREAAERSRVHVETIRRNVRSGDLHASRAGRALRIAPADLEA